MKKLVVKLMMSIIFLQSANVLNCQRTCGTLVPDLEVLQHTNYRYYQALKQIESHEENLKSSKVQITGSILTIPVIVHVIWRTTEENISDEQVESQIDALNEDFRYNNPDKSNIPLGFASLAADFEIEFTLSEIIRKKTTKSSFSISDANGNGVYDLSEEKTAGIKFSTHGSPAISTKQYLNIWVCNLAGTLLGYAQFPGGEISTDGIVVNYNAFGRLGTLNPRFDKGRTATHEIGHWLNLRHIWGDDGSACSGTDFIDDTPNQGGSYLGCPTHPSSSCSSNDMFMNYMDYTDDTCMHMFTKGQKTRMQALFSQGGVRRSFNCKSSTDLFGQIINFNTNVEDCNVNIGNVLVTNNSKLTVEAEIDVIINGEFEIEFGSTLEIK